MKNRKAQRSRVARRRSNRNRRMCARNTMRGGSWGFGYRNGEMLALGYPEHARYESCGGVSRPGMIAPEAVSGLEKGLPGMSGGARHRKGSRSAHRKSRRASRKQRGGRYETIFSDADQLALGPRGGTLASVSSLGGERGAGTPYPSPTECTGVTRGGGLAPAPFQQEQTAGYKFEASTYLDSVGAPLALRTPEGGRMDVPACKHTGGGKRRRSARRKAAKASRKSRSARRKASRKHRKTSRKH